MTLPPFVVEWGTFFFLGGGVFIPHLYKFRARQRLDVSLILIGILYFSRLCKLR